MRRRMGSSRYRNFVGCEPLRDPAQKTLPTPATPLSQARKIASPALRRKDLIPRKQELRRRKRPRKRRRRILLFGVIRRIKCQWIIKFLRQVTLCCVARKCDSKSEAIPCHFVAIEQTAALFTIRLRTPKTVFERL